MSITIEGSFDSSVTLQSLSDEIGSRVRRMRRKLKRKARLRGDGAIVWDKTGNIIDPEILREDMKLKVPSDHEEAYQRHLQSLSGSQEPTAEQAFEMRAAFGEGETVVNVMNGRRYET